MSQPLVTNGSINAVDPPNAKDANQVDEVMKDSGRQAKQPQTQANQPNVRHIPIFVEGRDEPLCNKNIDTVDAPVISRPPAPINDIPQSGSIFSRVKDIPIKKIIPEFHARNLGKAPSPARTIPINVVHTQTNSNSHPTQQNPNQAAPQQQQQQQQQDPQTDRRSQSPKPPQSVDPITKIHNIQKEILQLMDYVEKFKGGSGKDKEYMYLDEMLTQNLLKLDTIDTEGKENIKAARKEAINCINKCIQVLEAKADKSQSEDSANENSDNKENSGSEHPSKECSPEKGISSNSNTIESKEEEPPQNHGSSP